MVLSTNLGFPRIGANRELKKHVESYWSGSISEKQLLHECSSLRLSHWRLQQEAGIQHIPSDFSLYDQMLDMIWTTGATPRRYVQLKEIKPSMTSLEQYFAMARGFQAPEVDVPAMEMSKYLDTNYHIIRPEFEPDQKFSLRQGNQFVEHFREAKAAGIHTRPVLMGPVSFLLLGTISQGSPIHLLSGLVPVYRELVSQLVAEGADWIQMDEPCLVTDLDPSLSAAYSEAYNAICGSSPASKILVATYFDDIGSNLEWLSVLPVAGVHIDVVRAPHSLSEAIAKIGKTQTLSVGIVDGRNVWKTDLSLATSTVSEAVKQLGSDRVFVAPSCSLLHCPHSLASEKRLKEEIKDWLCFAVEKLAEVNVIANALNHGESSVAQILERNKESIRARATSVLIHNPKVRERAKSVSQDMFTRRSPFAVRRQLQQEKLSLPHFPTTTIGSFPQTREVRLARQKLGKGESTYPQYLEFIKGQIANAIDIQEKIELDVLVHGEFERNDMVEFFGEQLDGYAFTENGWVLSYGTRCVKPPIIFGDVQRVQQMTVELSAFAQSLTKRPVKGMLTGPVTCLEWSFVRNDQPRKDTAFQLALALRDEVRDLEAAGIRVIQIDEPAIREGLPLRKSAWENYLQWAVQAFLLTSSVAADTTQVHTHMCYSDFNDIFAAIKAMDADVLSIESSRSRFKVLKVFRDLEYTNDIGPGLYDIHSPRVPTVEEMKGELESVLKYLKPAQVWVNPDCGLKTRGWKEVIPSLERMVQVAKHFRQGL